MIAVIIWSNIGKVSDCSPSERASSGRGCTSTMMPSAPTATLPIARGLTSQRLPVACDGSTTTGRWVRWWSSGTAVRSSVLRVLVSNVRMPRSQRMIWLLPTDAMYSAAISHSSMVAPKPRLSITGRPARPQASSSEKFCMFRVPIWRMSAYSATMSTWLGSMTSVITGRPVRSRASAR